MQNSIIWSERYFPGMADNFISCETMRLGINIADVWDYISNSDKWNAHNPDLTDVIIHNSDGTKLRTQF